MVEAKVQSILTELESLAPDLQTEIYARLLRGLAAKLTASVATKALTAAKSEGQAPQPKAKPKVKKGTATPDGSFDVPRAHSMLRELNDPSDPIEAWHRFGESAADLLAVLKGEPLGVLDAMLLHPNMPPGPKVRGKSREKIAEAIALRLEQRFRS